MQQRSWRTNQTKNLSLGGALTLQSSFATAMWIASNEDCSVSRRCRILTVCKPAPNKLVFHPGWRQKASTFSQISIHSSITCTIQSTLNFWNPVAISDSFTDIHTVTSLWDHLKRLGPTCLIDEPSSHRLRRSTQVRSASVLWSHSHLNLRLCRKRQKVPKETEIQET